MERKYMKRFLSYKKSLADLSEARERDLNDSFVLSGTSAKFSITFDLALRKAFQTGMISGDEWMQMLQIRNELTHDYDGEIVKSHCQTIVQDYIDCFQEFQSWADELD